MRWRTKSVQRRRRRQRFPRFVPEAGRSACSGERLSERGQDLERDRWRRWVFLPGNRRQGRELTDQPVPQEKSLQKRAAQMDEECGAGGGLAPS